MGVNTQQSCIYPVVSGFWTQRGTFKLNTVPAMAHKGAYIQVIRSVRM